MPRLMAVFVGAVVFGTAQLALAGSERLLFVPNQYTPLSSFQEKTTTTAPVDRWRYTTSTNVVVPPPLANETPPR